MSVVCLTHQLHALFASLLLEWATTAGFLGDSNESIVLRRSYGYCETSSTSRCQSSSVYHSQHGRIPLSAFPSGTASELAGLYMLCLQWRTSCREAVNTNFKVNSLPNSESKPILPPQRMMLYPLGHVIGAGSENRVANVCQKVALGKHKKSVLVRKFIV